MTIEEIRTAKARAEKEILEVLRHLNRETSLACTAVNVKVYRYTDLDDQQTRIINYGIKIEMEGI